MSLRVYPYLPNMTTSLYSFHWLYLMCSLVCQHSKTQYNIHISDSLTHIGRIWYIKTGPSLLWWPNCLATKARYVSDIFHINLLIHIGLNITELQIVDWGSIAKVKTLISPLYIVWKTLEVLLNKTWVGFIHNSWSSLLSTSSILEQGF